MFKNVPLILEPLTPTNIYDQKQASPADVYKQIEDDLLAAIPVLPVSVPASDKGRLTKVAAMAILGKVYLYQGKMHWPQLSLLM